MSLLLAVQGGSPDGFATGAIASVSLSAVTGTASGSGVGSGSIAGITLTVPSGAASGSGVGSGSLAGVALTAPTGSAVGTTGSVSGTGTGSLAGVTLTAPAGSASGTSTVIDVRVSWIAFDTAATTEGAGKFKKFQVQTKRGIVEVDTLEEAHFVIRSLKSDNKAPVSVALEGVKVKVPSRATVDYKAIEARMRAEIQAELDDEEILLLM